MSGNPGVSWGRGVPLPSPIGERAPEEEAPHPVGSSPSRCASEQRITMYMPVEHLGQPFQRLSSTDPLVQRGHLCHAASRNYL